MRTTLRQAQGERERVSRREVLGAAVALPLSRHPGLDPGSTFSRAGEAERWIPDQVRNDEEWQRALAACRAAEAAAEAAGRVCAGELSRAEMFAAEEVYGDRLEQLYDALRRLLVVPAPAFAGFCIKVELMLEHELGTLRGFEVGLQAVREEALRLRSGQARRLLLTGR
jgi:hypothetical protein